MVYVIAGGEIQGKVLLVKADNREDVEARVRLKEDEDIVGSLTNNELSALDTSSFAVITA